MSYILVHLLWVISMSEDDFPLQKLIVNKIVICKLQDKRKASYRRKHLFLGVLSYQRESEKKVGLKVI